MNTNRTIFTQNDFHAKRQRRDKKFLAETRRRREKNKEQIIFHAKVQRGKDAKTSITHPKHGRHGLNAE